MLKAYRNTPLFPLSAIDPDIVERYETAASGFVDKPEWAAAQFALLSQDMHYRSGATQLFKPVVDISYAKTLYDSFLSKQARISHAAGKHYIETFMSGQTTEEIEQELENQLALYNSLERLAPWLWIGYVDDNFGLASCYGQDDIGDSTKTLSGFINLLAVPSPILQKQWTVFDVPIVQSFCDTIIKEDSSDFRIPPLQLTRDCYIKQGNWFLDRYIKYKYLSHLPS